MLGSETQLKERENLNVSEEASKELGIQERPKEDARLLKLTQESLEISDKHLRIKKIAGDPIIQEKRKEIERLAKIVYGDSRALDEKLAQINETLKLGDSIAEQIKLYPESLSKLAGRRVLGISSTAHKQARDHVSELSAAVQDYTDTGYLVVKKAIRKIIRERIHLREAVEMPSQELQNVLFMPEEIQQEVIQSSYTLQKELNDFLNEVDARLTERERSAIEGEEDGIFFEGPRDLSQSEKKSLADIIEKAQEVHQRVQELKGLEHVFIPRRSPPLTEEALFQRISENLSLQEERKKIERLSEIVYGNSEVLYKHLEQINKDPELGKEFSERIACSPWSILGPKDSEISSMVYENAKDRMSPNAESHVLDLSEAIKNYTNVAKRVRAEQARSTIAVAMPSEELKNTLSMPKDVRLEAFVSSFELQEELYDFVHKIDARLSPNAHQAVKENDYGKLSESLGVSVNKAKDILEIVKQIKEAYGHVQAFKECEHVCIPSQSLPPLEREEIFKRISEASSIQERRKEVERLSEIVYGNSEVLHGHLERINRDPELGEEFAEQIARSPQSVSRLAGFEILNIFGKNLRNQTRKHAENHVLDLSDSVESYTNAARFVETEMFQEHRLEQRRRAQAVAKPSEKLQDVLSMSKDMRREALVSSSALQKELHNFMNKVDARLSRNEHQAVKENDYGKLSESLGISVDHAKDISSIIKKAEEAYEQVRMLKADRAQAVGMIV